MLLAERTITDTVFADSNSYLFEMFDRVLDEFREGLDLLGNDIEGNFPAQRKCVFPRQKLDHFHFMRRIAGTCT